MLPGVQSEPSKPAHDENAVFQWEEGYRAAPGSALGPRRSTGRWGGWCVAVEDELRRRLGSTFTVGELVDLYRQGTDWALELAIGRYPEDSRLWDLSIGADAAFYLYMREAADYAGGRAPGLVVLAPRRRPRRTAPARPRRPDRDRLG